LEKELRKYGRKRLHENNDGDKMKAKEERKIEF